MVPQQGSFPTIPGNPARPNLAIPAATQRLIRQTKLKLAAVQPDTTPLDISVVICTYNGEHRLPDVLKGLLWQFNTIHLAWEVIVVDNNSSDNTAQVVKTFRSRWPAHIPLRYCFEPRQGLAYARQKAIEMARSSLVGFLDDDNCPALLWVNAAHQFSQHHPQAGVYGSRIRGDFEASPPPYFERIAPLLALIDRGNTPLLYQPHQKVLPPGAGLVVRRSAWLEQVPTTLALAAWIGNRGAGEDLEAILHIQRQGWEVWYNPHMRLFHKIPQHRLQRDYLLQLGRSIGLSRHRTRMLSCPRWQRPLMVWLYLLNDLRKIGQHLLRYRRAVLTDTVTRCELTLYCYSLISPLYLWQQSWRKLWQQ
jgi:GT2 family glycosyltransferase